MKRREWQLHLRLNPGRAGHLAAGRVPGQVLEQRRLADPGLAVQHQGLAVAAENRRGQPAQRIALGPAAVQRRRAPLPSRCDLAHAPYGSRLYIGIPRAVATWASSARERMPSLTNTCRRCELTVYGDRNRRSATSRLVAPRATRVTTANSDSVSSGQSAACRGPPAAGRTPRARSRLRTRAASRSAPAAA